MESDYDKIMNPIKKIKLAEQKEGKISPTFDALPEPNFPNEAENNKTLEGVDSNHDGVRDDIEIWINRTAEDQYVRIALKDYYKKLFELNIAVVSSSQEPLVRGKLNTLGMSSMCLITTLMPYDKKYLNTKKENAGLYFKSKLQALFLNSKIRTSANESLNKFQFEGAVGEEEANYCKTMLGKYYDFIINKYQEHRK